MSTTYVGKSGKQYTVITPAVGKGGEGSVYKISNMPNCVLKVFLDGKRTETRHRKLLAMIGTPLSQEAMKQVTWPMDVVYENNQFVGYVMPAISNCEDLNVMYSDKYDCTLSEKITLGKNLCAAVNAVHNAGQVCGDLNPKNIGVDPKSARITLVDTDSYHITEKNSGRVYRCEVGLPEYLPHEIQNKMKNGQTLANAPLPTFTKYTDLFALAVHIFALLMNGCHPFACAINNTVNIGQLTNSQMSVAAPQPIDNICNGFFPFHNKKQGITTPKYAPEFGMLPSRIQDLFIRAFESGYNNPSARPDAVEWYAALEDLEKNLTSCSTNSKHIYPKGSKNCPWCEIENRLKQPVVPPKPVYQATTIQQTPISISANTTTSPSSSSYNNSKTDKLMETEKMFWIMTMVISLGIQAVAHFLTGNMIVREVFGGEYGSGIESWGSNLAIWLGPWGFIICAAIGVYMYNTYWSGQGKMYGYKWYHYVLSVLSSILFSAGWILLIFIISLAIMLIVGAIIIAIICGALSGS